MEESITIFGVSLKNQSKKEILQHIEAYIEGQSQRMVATPNPEMLLMARKNPHFKNALNRAALRLIDGFGLVMLARFFYHSHLERYTGVDAVKDIVALAERKNKKVFLLGGSKAVLEKLIDKWSRAFPTLQIMSAEGPSITLNQNNEKGFIADEVVHARVVKLIQREAPDILLAGFGHGKQELWLNATLSHLPSVKLAMGVGGSFDYMSGVVPRAPQWMRHMGLEWLYRVAREPRRIKRIFDAVILFPLYAFYERKS